MTSSGASGGVVLLGAVALAANWTMHNFWLLIGVVSALIAAYMFLRAAFQNFRELTFGHFVVFAILVGTAYVTLAYLHPQKLYYADVEKWWLSTQQRHS